MPIRGWGETPAHRGERLHDSRRAPPTSMDHDQPGKGGLRTAQRGARARPDAHCAADSWLGGWVGVQAGSPGHPLTVNWTTVPLPAAEVCSRRLPGGPALCRPWNRARALGLEPVLA